MALVGLIRRAAGYLVHGGSWTIRPYETQVLDTLKSTLARSDVEALEAQLARLDHVKRLHADRMVTFYFQDAAALPRLSQGGDAQCLLRLRIEGDGRKLSVEIFAHRGLLSSMEFDKSPTDLRSSAALRIRPVKSRSAPGIAAEIDKTEHE